MMQEFKEEEAMDPRNEEEFRKIAMSQRRSQIALVIPTLNAAGEWCALLDGIRKQTILPQQLIIIDSSSSDGTATHARNAGFEVIEIDRKEFGHGRTRQIGAERANAANILIYLTQDAIPSNSTTFENILQTFDDPAIGAAYGRQLPRQSAKPLEAHARLFNYPGSSRVRTWECRRTLGFKSIFFSNSFAAYRREALMSVGGFPPDVIFGEDTVVAARLHRSGWKTAYVANALVFHSHSYSISEEFKRYFDIGVLHARESWLVEEFGTADREGLGFALSEIRFLLAHDVLSIPSSVVRTVTKYLGYQVGKRESQIGVRLKSHLGRNKDYWLRSYRDQQPQ